MQGVDAVVVIIEDEGRVLGVSRPGLPEDVGLPGGSIDPGETPEQAAVREVKEETGLDVTVRHLVTRPFHSHLVHAFVATSFSGVVHASEEGEAKWTDWDGVCSGRYGAFNRELQKLCGRT
ncbi:MAG: NUDIX domain-containing protein [Myxococcaceae bacterium]